MLNAARAQPVELLISGCVCLRVCVCLYVCICVYYVLLNESRAVLSNAIKRYINTLTVVNQTHTHTRKQDVGVIIGLCLNALLYTRRVYTI